MTQTTFTEFRKHAKRYFNAVERGETVRVVRRGKVIAEIRPPHVLVDDKPWKRPGLKMVIPGVSVTKAFLEDRRSARF